MVAPGFLNHFNKFTMNQKSGAPPQPETSQKRLVATQKSFIFKKGFFEDKDKFAERVDDEVNEWLLKRSNDGTPATLGKVCSNHRTGEVIYIFLYSRKFDIKK